MGFAFAVLHMSPAAFWQMTPRELAAAIRFATGSSLLAPAARTDLAALMALFPDTPAGPEV